MSAMSTSRLSSALRLLLLLFRLLLELVSSPAACRSSSVASNVFNVIRPGVRSALFPNGTGITRSDFPESFLFGSITSAMKHEGAEYTDQKAQNIWDVFAKRKQNATLDGAIPGQCGNNYNQYKEDHQLLVDLGMDAYRFSISWSRLYPNGSGEANAVAIAHYNKVIDDVLDKGLIPVVTLWTQDHPQVLEERYGGALSSQFIDDFAIYAETCFKEFGDRVKVWITFDEANDWAGLGYSTYEYAPGRCTPGIIGQAGEDYGYCTEGDSGLEPYMVGHNILLAHAEAVSIYRDKYQATQNGSIGLINWFKWFEPLTNSTEDHAAAQRAIDYSLGWFLDPIFFGDYPASMREYLGSRLPTFTTKQISKLRLSLDFIGLNLQTAMYVYDHDWYLTEPDSCYYLDWRVNSTGERGGVKIGEGDEVYAVPWIMKSGLEYTSNRYHNFPTYITQTGWGIAYESSEETLNDEERVHFFQTYYDELRKAISEGVDVRGVFAWSLIDGFEFMLGMGIRVGLHYVDGELQRLPRLSALWFKEMLATNTTTTSS